MMKNRAAGVFILMLIGLLTLQSQDPVARIWYEVDSIHGDEYSSGSSKQVSPWNFQTGVGTSFGFFPGKGSVMNYFVAPTVRYNLNQRTSLHAGVAATYAVSGLSSISEDPIHGNGISMFSAYFSGAYRLTDNLVIHGTGTKAMVYSPWIENMDFMEINDFSIGATYNFGNFSIGASFHRSDNLFYGSPFGFGRPMLGY